MKIGWPLASALAALVAATPALAQTTTAPVSGTILEFSADGSVERAPDIATVSAGVVTQAATASAAMRANASRMTAVIAALKAAGIADRDVRTATLSLQPQYRYANGQPPALTGYQASDQLMVTLRDLARAGAILDALVGQGVNQIEGPTLALDHPEAALDEARAQAIATARARADLYARAAGLHVKRIVAIREGSVDSGAPRPVMFAMARAEKAPATPIAAGTQKLGVTVNVSFELD